MQVTLVLKYVGVVLRSVLYLAFCSEFGIAILALTVVTVSLMVNLLAGLEVLFWIVLLGASLHALLNAYNEATDNILKEQQSLQNTINVLQASQVEPVDTIDDI